QVFRPETDALISDRVEGIEGEFVLEFALAATALHRPSQIEARDGPATRAQLLDEIRAAGQSAGLPFGTAARLQTSVLFAGQHDRSGGRRPVAEKPRRLRVFRARILRRGLRSLRVFRS